ncbi:MAG: GIY-YIG nuclease family protein [Xanthomonadales bacterium]|nr:GIY-YIG nuclease family protein [Xanthomonadales bacterium]
MGWFVYIIEASDGSLYTGVTTDVERRFAEHSDSDKGAKFFRGRKPRQIVYQQTQADRSSALKREAEIKKLTRENKLTLIGQFTHKPPGRPC